MKVRLLSYTRYPLRVIFSSARQCYSKDSAYKIFKDSKVKSRQEMQKFIEKLIKRGHLSPLEHVSFVFGIEGISRVCTHQLVRHRIASFSQQSQRYVFQNFKFIIPSQIKKNLSALKKFNEITQNALDAYKQIYKILIEAGVPQEKAKEDARFVLPQAMETKIVVSMNARELLHFFGERLCMKAQWEIRELASKMRALCMKVLPEVFIHSGPKCKRLGFCPEEDSNCLLYGKYFKV